MKAGRSAAVNTGNKPVEIQVSYSQSLNGCTGRDSRQVTDLIEAQVCQVTRYSCYHRITSKPSNIFPVHCRCYILFVNEIGLLKSFVGLITWFYSLCIH